MSQNNTARSTGSILDSVRRDMAAAAAQQGNTVTPIHGEAGASNDQRRKPSDFWLNVGIVLKDAGKDEDGNPTDLFISLPVGLPLDDMKPQKISGQNQDWIQLAQTKNKLLEELQKAAGSLQPGERAPVPMLSVELYRRNEPAQQGDPSSNSLVGALMQALRPEA